MSFFFYILRFWNLMLNLNDKTTNPALWQCWSSNSVVLHLGSCQNKYDLCWSVPLEALKIEKPNGDLWWVSYVSEKKLPNGYLPENKISAWKFSQKLHPFTLCLELGVRWTIRFMEERYPTRRLHRFTFGSAVS